MSRARLAPTMAAAFLASLAEFVEALAIVLAVGTVRGWRPAFAGTGAAATPGVEETRVRFPSRRPARRRPRGGQGRRG